MTETATPRIYERHGLVGELIYEEALCKLLSGEITAAEALDYIMQFARGDWPLVVDENLKSLADELARMNYDVETVPKGMPDR